MSPIVVQKYGGSSVADVEKIKQVARRVVATKERGYEVCVVVSAMGKTTDQLIELARAVSPAPPRRELDMLLSCGERIAMALLSMAVHELGHQAISFTGSQSGIMTNDRHSGARIIEVRPVRVQDELERGRIVIVAGFQGVSYKREITTLGRGGSDTTAVAMAAALGAEYCEICSDVDGVYTADPRVVPAAQLLRAVSCDEMQELAAHGARVLHRDAVEFARRSGITVYARATEGGGAGTRIGGDTAIGERDSRVAGVTGKRKLVRAAVRGAGALDWLLETAGQAGLPLLHVQGDEAGATAWLVLDDVPDWAAVKATMMAGGKIRGLELAEEQAAVTVVGDGVGGDGRLLARARAAAAEAGCPPAGLATSPLRFTMFCAPEQVDPLQRALHAALVLAQ
jgi:aspartate kinase